MMKEAFWKSIRLAVGATALVAMLAVGLTSGCGHPTAPSPPTAPVGPPIAAPPPPPPAPTLVCPPPILATTTATATPVTYQTPSAEGGESPVSVACSPPSGNTFPVGSTEVRCTATDSLNRTTSCVFDVSVSRLPTISKTRFLAFGDSVTLGVVSTLKPDGSGYDLRDLTNEAYPQVLEQMLGARYTTQTFSVMNEGKGGELAVNGVGRLSGAISANRPEAVLILEGYNDVRLGEEGIEPAIAAITDMAKDARFRGARVFLATMTPPPLNVNRGISNTTIVRFNQKLRIVARGEGAVLVDVYEAWASDPNRYNSADGQHPNEAGYRKIAETFFAAIQAELEVR